MQKFKNKWCEYDGIKFQSKKEMNRYCELKILQRAGEISNLELQKEFELIPAQREFTNEIGKNGCFKKGKVIERAVKYKADFVYQENGKIVVEDTKGVRTKDYIIKRKLMLFIHGIRIKEI